MANADGSIRIEATVSDEQAKKQIAQMSKDIEKQTAAVERQAEKVKKLAAQWEKVSSGGARGLKMKSDLEATEAEAKKLAQQLEIAGSGERIRNLAQNELGMLRRERAQTETIYIQAPDKKAREEAQAVGQTHMEILDFLLGLLNVFHIGE